MSSISAEIDAIVPHTDMTTWIIPDRYNDDAVVIPVDTINNIKYKLDFFIAI
ncbi:MAG: hypothetical protein ACLU8W_07910 [Clostridia bacterium]